MPPGVTARMQPRGWLPLTGKWLRRSVGLLLVAGGSLGLLLVPTGVAVSVNGTFLPFHPVALLMIVAGVIISLAP
jgi:hypothetical protein